MIQHVRRHTIDKHLCECHVMYELEDPFSRRTKSKESSTVMYTYGEVDRIYKIKNKEKYKSK